MLREPKTATQIGAIVVSRAGVRAGSLLLTRLAERKFARLDAAARAVPRLRRESRTAILGGLPALAAPRAHRDRLRRHLRRAVAR